MSLVCRSGCVSCVARVYIYPELPCNSHGSSKYIYIKVTSEQLEWVLSRRDGGGGDCGGWMAPVPARAARATLFLPRVVERITRRECCTSRLLSFPARLCLAGVAVCRGTGAGCCVCAGWGEHPCSALGRSNPAMTKSPGPLVYIYTAHKVITPHHVATARDGLAAVCGW